MKYNYKIQTISFLAFIFFASFLLFDRWKSELEGGDSLGYYIHLPSFFLYHDVGNYDKTLAASSAHYNKIQLPGVFAFTPEPAPNNKKSIRWPVGVAILTLPFFAFAHLLCFLTGIFPADGFSTPYLFAAGIAPIVYVVWGLYILFGVLSRYFNVQTRILTILVIGLTTNLYYFTAYHNYMAHPFIFFAGCLLLSKTIEFWETPNYRNAIWVGFSTGLIAAIRLHDVIWVLVPLLWNVNSFKLFWSRIQFVFLKIGYFLLAAVSGGILLIPQAFYYKAISGQWWWYAYGNEKLNFADPHILGGLFDYRNGWLIYTPVMVFAFIGLLWISKYVKGALLPILVLTPLHMYISYSWWCWYYTNGYGSRPMIDIYPLLALSLASFLALVSKKWWHFALISPVFLFLTWLNIFQVWQFEHGILWSQFENRAHYWSVFGKSTHNLSDLIAFESNETQPATSLQTVRTLLENDFEDTLKFQSISDVQHSGKFAMRMGASEFGGTMGTEPGAMKDVQPGDWISVSCWSFNKSAEKTWDVQKLAALVVTIQDPGGDILKYRQIKLSSKIGNERGSIYSSGEPDTWGKAIFYVKIPQDFPPNGFIRTYVWNPSRENISIDDMSVELCRR